MTGYNDHGVRRTYYQGHEYAIVRDGHLRLVLAEYSTTGICHVHADRGSTR